MENNQVTPPEWYQAMKEWQKEDTVRRSVCVIASDETNSYNGLAGHHLPLVMAFATAMMQHEDIKDIVEAAMDANEKPVFGLVLHLALAKLRKAHGFGSTDTTSKDSSNEESQEKGMLETLLSKLMGKS